MADARDLKSRGLKKPCGFESRHRHQSFGAIRTGPGLQGGAPKLKSVLFINRVYPPDEGATGQLLAELAEALAREGWSVTVLAAGGGKVDPRSSQRNGVTVHRVRGLPFTRASLVRRALSYLSLYPALLWRALRLPRHDVTVTLTDPPLLLVLGPWIRLFKRGRLVHWAQDVYPEVAEELGVLRRRGLGARVLRAFSSWSLRRHHHVVAVGRCMKERLLARGLPAEAVSVIPNWAVGFSSVPVAPVVAEGPLTVLYSGNFGLAHPFASIIEAVRKLDGAAAPVRFIFAGSGPRLGLVRDALASCRNVEFRPPAPLEELATSLAGADVHLACMSEELLGLVVPSKIYGALAVGRPCVFLGPSPSEAARVFAESGRGVVLPPGGSGESLAALLTRWAGRDAEFRALQAVCLTTVPDLTDLPLAEWRRVLDGPAA